MMALCRRNTAKLIQLKGLINDPGSTHYQLMFLRPETGHTRLFLIPHPQYKTQRSGPPFVSKLWSHRLALDFLLFITADH